MSWDTRFGSLDSYEKGGVEVIADDPKNYAFSNVFAVAERAQPYEQIVVAKNFEYVLEVVRAEGESDWRICNHDQTALIMDGQVEFRFRTAEEVVDLPENGSIRLDGPPSGTSIGRVVAQRGHLTLLPAQRAYQMQAFRLAVVLIQTIEGPDSQERWSEICQLGL